MSAKRKDKKGRVLRTGESKRKDLTYQYRYQDITGKRRTVYAPTLEELRAKEEEINNAVNIGVDYNAGNVTVLELLERYISLKQGVRNATKVGYNFVFNLVKKEDFGHRKIRDIKTSDAKLWLMKLQKDGRGCRRYYSSNCRKRRLSRVDTQTLIYTKFTPFSRKVT